MDNENGEARKVSVSLGDIAENLFKISENELDSIIKEKGTDFDPVKFIERQYVNSIGAIKEESQTRSKELAGKVSRETAERKEKEFYSKLGLEYKGQKGDEYYTAITDHFSKSDNNDELLTLKEKFNNAIKEKSELLKSFETEKEKAIREITSQYETKERVNKIKDLASDKYLSRNDLSRTGDKAVDEYRNRLFKEELAKLNTKFNEDGSVDLLDENGELMKDEKHHVVTFDQVANDILRKTIGISVQSGKSSTGVGAGKSFSTSAPKSLADFNKAYSEETDPVKKQEMYKAFKEQNN